MTYNSRDWPNEATKAISGVLGRDDSGLQIVESFADHPLALLKIAREMKHTMTQAMRSALATLEKPKLAAGTLKKLRAIKWSAVAAHFHSVYMLRMDVGEVLVALKSSHPDVPPPRKTIEVVIDPSDDVVVIRGEIDGERVCLLCGLEITEEYSHNKILRGDLNHAEAQVMILHLCNGCDSRKPVGLS